MSEPLSYLIPLQFAEPVRWRDGNKLWLQIYPYDTWDHPMYGETTIDKQRADTLKYHFDSGIRGHDVVVDYEHGLDPAKGKKAAGWYRQLEVRNDGLWGLVEFSDTAKSEIDAGEWKYFSGEHYDTWTHPQSGETYDYVLSGGGLTNKPWVKGMIPLNFSEVMIEKEFATTPTKPYGDVTYADPGYQSDKKKRYPLDTETHIRAAWSYINMPKNAAKYTSSQLASIKSKIRAAMKRVGAQMAAEAAAIEEDLNTNLMSEEEATAIIENEVKEWEHSDPGTGSPPIPRLDEESGIDEPDRTGGWRRKSPPDQDAPPGPDNPSSQSTPSEGGNTLSEPFVDKDVQELRRVLDLPVDAPGDKIVETIKVKFGELHSLREAVSAADQEKVFAEQYPQYWNEHRKLMERDREHSAKSFSESVSTIRDQQGYGLVDTKKGLSTTAKDKLVETHKKFSEGTVTLEDFEECIKAITNGGIVQFGEIGNATEDNLPDIDTNSAVGVAGARRLFAEVISKVQKEHPDWEYMRCVAEAGSKHPDLADAYKVTLPA